jgi:threonine 3-dehydrogenase
MGITKCISELGINTRFGPNCPGSFAEYVCIPEANVVPIPDNISDEIAAIFDPFGNAVHTALSFDLVGEDVLVTGAGPIGIMGALVAQKVGARKVVITDISPYRINLAKRLGVQHVVNAAEETLSDVMTRIGMTEGFDVGLEMSGAAPAMRDMIDKMNNGGKMALLGIAPTEFAVDWNEIIFKMLTVKGIYGREIFETWYKMIALVQSGLNLTDLITHRIDIDEFESGFAAMISGEAGKIVMDWG